MLKSYISHKTVMAEPMSRKEAERKGLVRDPEPVEAKDEPGYRVVYKDGYESWSPKEAFEDGYTSNEIKKDEDDSAQKTFDFGVAIRCLKDGHKVARKGWNGKNMYLVLVEPTNDMSCDSVSIFEDIAKPLTNYPESPCGKYVPTDSYIVMRTAQKTAQPGWLASQADMLATDWMLVN